MSIRQKIDDAKELVGTNQRLHAKDWLDAHGYEFGWKETKDEGLVLARVNERTGLAERPDEVLEKKEHKELKKYVRGKCLEDARLKRARKLTVG